MNKYRIVFKCKNGFEGEEIICAVNRTMAFEIFEKVDCFKDIAAANCFLIIE